MPLLTSQAANWLFRNLAWVLTIVGISLFLIGHLSLENPQPDLSILEKINETFPSILKGLGVAILSSGIFAAILKSIQFSGIFQEELANLLFYLKWPRDYKSGSIPIYLRVTANGKHTEFSTQ